MLGLRTLPIAGALAGALLAPAHAADVAERRLPPPRPVERLQPIGSAWYLRGDIGYRGHTVRNAVGETGFPAPTENTLNGAMWGGVGAGFISDWVRVDLTVDYSAPANYSGTAGGSTATARIQSINALFNVYYDLGTWAHVTPYLGLGAGYARVTASDYQSAAIPPLNPVDSSSRWNFAWAAMAGASYQFTRSLAVDAGYRYLNLGDAETAGGTSGKLTLRSITAHEFRIGVRWMYDTPSHAVYRFDR